MDAPAEDTDRTALEAAAEVAEGEVYWDAGWPDGVRGWLFTGSAVEVMSHLGGMRDCLSGRGSCRAFRRASGSKCMSDSAENGREKLKCFRIGTLQAMAFCCPAPHSEWKPLFEESVIPGSAVIR